jgi:acylphosphatase
MKKPVRAHAIITGRVQGVCFRMETCRAVEHLAVSGWVRNKRDGTVEAVFEGEEADVKAALEWCHKGPSISRVEDVKVSWQDYAGEFIDFNVTY